MAITPTADDGAGLPPRASESATSEALIGAELLGDHLEEVMSGLPGPDPRLSVNIYCAGRLSDLIHRVVAPVWANSQPADEGDLGYLWLMRYARGGEHLKVRLHGGAALASSFRGKLAEALEAYFASLPELTVEQSEARPSSPQSTPIDEQDRQSEDHPDRSFCWTTYQRSPISLGSGPYLEDDLLVAAHTRALAHGTEIVLERLRTNEQGQATFGQLQGLLLQILIAGLAAAPLAVEDRARYLRYHRDWLLRSALKYGRSGGGERKMADTLATFNKRVEGLADRVKPIGRLARRRWSQPAIELGASASSAQPEESEITRFEHAIAALFEHLDPVLEERRFRIDPFADRPQFPPLFRLLHSVSNQLGINSLNEAFCHHLLLQIATDGDAKTQGVVLSPVL